MLAANTKIPLAVPTWGEEEVNEAIDSLKSGMLTMGKKVKRFEEMWAKYCGVRHGVMTNSGSSANLLLLSALKATARLTDGEIITPALTWATTVFPIAQVGCIPVLSDVGRKTYNLDPYAMETAITPKTKAIMLVHLLGNPCEMDVITDIARRRRLLLIEDSCEAHGAEYHGRRVGSFGDAATFSFFFSHHISTIEGGMVMTNNTALAEACRAMRVFGWIRDLQDKANLAAASPDIDPRFLFQYPGYNFRPTEIGGAFGIHQVPKLEGLIAIRRDNAAYWNKELAEYQTWLQLPEEWPNTRHVSFAYVVTVKPGAPFTGKQLMVHLESRGVECRPIEAGAMHLQPAMSQITWRAGGSLKNAEYIHRNGFFWGNNGGIGAAEREAVVEYVREFLCKF